jgi:hypothetical protein
LSARKIKKARSKISCRALYSYGGKLVYFPPKLKTTPVLNLKLL